MVFSSFTFLCYFLPLTLLGYYIIPNLKLRNLFLLIASVIFYAANDYKCLFYLFNIIFATYICALFISKETSGLRKVFLLGGLVFIFGLLFYFKYTTFTLVTIGELLQKNWIVSQIVMPIGISFYTFQAASYLIDVYRGGAVQKNFFNLALYISMFPQLVAGPIVRYDSIKNELTNRTHSIENIYLGFQRFLVGLGKKIIIADVLGLSVDRIFTTPVENLSVQIVWVGIIFYSLQIYFDFSAYSDMAIGLGKMLGFKFPENFNYPYIAKSISEFWRRWHISLSSWFKEYVYIPLGGNKKGLKRTCFNLMIVFLLTGIWHGANWTFILWGVWYGIFIVIEKCVFQYFHVKMNIFYSILARLYTLFVVIIGWVLFKSDSIEHAYRYIKALFGCIPFQQKFGIDYYVRPGCWMIAILAIVLSLGITRFIPLLKNRKINLVYDLFLFATLFLCILLLTANSYSPFIYFNF